MTVKDNRKQEASNGEIEGEPQDLELAREKVAPLLKKNIFLISQDQHMTEMIQAYLKTLGFQPGKTETSGSPSELIQQIQKTPASVDLVIYPLDSQDASQPGIQLIENVQKTLSDSGCRGTIPFIFLAKKFKKKDVVSAPRDGTCRFLLMPTTPISLGTKIVEIFERTKDSPSVVEVSNLILEGGRLREKGSFDEAIKCYNKALEIGGANVEVLTEKGNTFLKQGNIDEAIQCFIESTGIEASFPRAYQGLGQAFTQLGDYQEAKKNYLKVIDLEPENAQAYHDIGALYRDEGDHESARYCFEKGVNYNKSFLNNYLGLAETYESLNKPKESWEVYKDAMEANPNQTLLFLKAGNFCLKQELYEKAEKVFGKALGRSRHSIHLYNRMGIALRKQKKFQEAISNFAKAITIKPGDANLLYNLAKAYYLSGNESTAMDKLKVAFGQDQDLKLKFQKDRTFSKLIAKYPENSSFS